MRRKSLRAGRSFKFKLSILILSAASVLGMPEQSQYSKMEKEVKHLKYTMRPCYAVMVRAA